MTHQKLYIRYEETSTGGDRLSCEPYSDREPEYRTFEILGAYRNGEADIGTDEFTVNFDLTKVSRVFAVVVRYSTGDTFGHSYGHHYFEGIYKSEDEAIKIAESIKAYDRYNDKNRKDKSEYWQYKELKKLSSKPCDYVYLPWAGYFERLEDVELHELSLQDEIKTSSGIKRFKH